MTDKTYTAVERQRALATLSMLNARHSDLHLAMFEEMEVIYDGNLDKMGATFTVFLLNALEAFIKVMAEPEASYGEIQKKTLEIIMVGLQTVWALESEMPPSD